MRRAGAGIRIRHRDRTGYWVAYPELKGMSETDENGTRHGIVVDYLNEIAKYTGWQGAY